MIKIIVDSTSGLTQTEALKAGLGFLPITFIAENKKHREGIDIDSEWVLNQLENNIAISTSQPPVGVVEEIVGKEAKENDQVLIITISSKLSGTYSTAYQVAENYDNVHVIDSKLGGPPIAHLAKWANDIKNNYTIEKLISLVQEKAKELKIVFIPATLEQLAKSGRVSKPIALMGKLIGILPILSIDSEGFVQKQGKTRNRKKAIGKIIKEFESMKKICSSLVILETHTDKDLIEYSKKEIEKLGFEVEIVMPSGAITRHVGPGTIGVATGKIKKA